MADDRARRAWRRLGAALLVTPLQRAAVVADSVPAGTARRDGCPRCGAAPLPVRPGGRCGACGARAGAPPYLLELGTLAAGAVVVVAVAAGGWSPWAAVALAGWAALVVPLVFIDLAAHRLPDRYTLPAAGWVLAWLGVAAAADDAGGAWVRAALAALVCGTGFGLFALIPRSYGYGLGDAKLALGAAALLGWQGWTTVVAGLFLAFLGSGVVAAVLLVLRRVGWRDALPFGPFLIAGTLVTIAWAGLG